MSIQYHKYFNEKHFNPEVVTAVRVAIKSGLFKRDNSIDDKFKIIQELHSKLCLHYEIPQCNLILDINYLHCGHYSVETNEITINKPSLVTYLHEFCHYYMIATKQLNNENIARGWSISLYFIATPKLCKNAIEKGLIVHQNKIVEDIQNV